MTRTRSPRLPERGRLPGMALGESDLWALAGSLSLRAGLPPPRIAQRPAWPLLLLPRRMPAPRGSRKRSAYRPVPGRALDTLRTRLRHARDPLAGALPTPG